VAIMNKYFMFTQLVLDNIFSTFNYLGFLKFNNFIEIQLNYHLWVENEIKQKNIFLHLYYRLSD